MKYNPEVHHRRSIRLKEYDYSQTGGYFLTICTHNRECLFGEIVNGKMLFNEAGIMIENVWIELKNRFPNIELDAYVVMPNHFHGIITLVGATLVVAQNKRAGINPAPTNAQNKRAGINPAPTNAPTIGDIMGAFKSITTHQYTNGVNTQNWQPFDKKLWQRNYFEHIIRDEKSLNKIREYIINNPLSWQTDDENPYREGVM